MKVGSIVYATDQGLGVLAKAFYDHRVVTDVCVIRHGRHETHDDWYPGAPHISNLRDPNQTRVIEKFASSMDVMLFFETPFHWPVIEVCRRAKVRTCLMPMFECEPVNLPAQPDAIVNPSLLDQQYYPRGVFIPVPIEYPWKLRTKAEVFVHNAGHGGLKGRNGTAEVIEAARYIKSGAKIVLRAQEASRQYWAAGQLQDASNNPTYVPKNVELRIGTFPYQELYSEGDVFLFPECFNGLSLPLQEAYAAGMLVMCGNRFPMNTWLPREPLIPVSSYSRERVGPPYNEYDRANFDPKIIAQTIDVWYGVNIEAYSLMGKGWAEANSWEVLGPKYTELLESL